MQSVCAIMCDNVVPIIYARYTVREELKATSLPRTDGQLRYYVEEQVSRPQLVYKSLIVDKVQPT
jgi:hypothetical protein